MPLKLRKSVKKLKITQLVQLIWLALFLIFIIFLVIWLKPQANLLFNPFVFSEPVQQINEPFSGQLYFNDQLGQNKLSQLVIAAIDSAQATIELAVYSFSDQDIKEAIYQAANRGVKVTIILDAGKSQFNNQLLSDLPENIRRIDIKSKRGYMHHKFIIIDRGQSSGQLLFGSYNFTKLQDRYDPSFLLISPRPELVDSFGREIDRLANNNYGRKKILASDCLAERFQYTNGFLEIWFGPQTRNRGLRNRMIDLIYGTKNSLKGMIWNFTDRDLAHAMLTVARRHPVTMIIDDVNWTGKYSVNQIMTKSLFNKLEIITDHRRNQEVKDLSGQDDLNSFLHHHALIIDDQTVVFGTNNWSSGGFFDNDESTIISNIDSLVQSFGQSFLFNYQKNQ
ncbi:MAG TPA: phospholipase D-like domain-containing protein [bacterium]|jgi:phosphatidylserine/phosphatidylglycerophosphate/cardiolipin synthase-like enzyme|nr:phospholipase D-like domain-containing protein [bacterium]HNZ51090.1 phospholipase D-like domain-containing protein [bacterium]HOF79854.1 phospholipase D-like domain-containing protein [bacterium]HOH85362.1 phospholipase D-like domain-containing protein [bacterium]HPL22572.1 phospholipase D-like domain-containing protein [bacterium]